MKKIREHIDKYGGWWFISLVGLAAMLLMGCKSSEEFQNLLYEDEDRNLARKSITIKDIIVKDDC